MTEAEYQLRQRIASQHSAPQRERTVRTATPGPVEAMSVAPPSTVGTTQAIGGAITGVLGAIATYFNPVIGAIIGGVGGITTQAVAGEQAQRESAEAQKVLRSNQRIQAETRLEEQRQARAEQRAAAARPQVQQMPPPPPGGFEERPADILARGMPR